MGLTLITLCSCHFMAERLSVGVQLAQGLSLSQQPSLTRSEGLVSQTPQFPTLLAGRLMGQGGRRRDTLSGVREEGDCVRKHHSRERASRLGDS